MPNRIIKESIRTSRAVNAMTDFQFRFWVYLITYVDDYGRGSADPELLKGFVLPRRKSVTESTIEKTLAELAAMGLIDLYQVDGESYLCFPNWGVHQRIQNKKSKYPEPQKGHPPSSAVNHGGLPPESNPNPNPESQSEEESKGGPAPLEKVKELYNRICRSYPRCTAVSEARRRAVRAGFAAGYGLEDFERLFEKAEASAFLKGENTRNWSADFDWLVKDGNMAKVLDGNYDGEKGGRPKGPEPSYDLEKIKKRMEEGHIL